MSRPRRGSALLGQGVAQDIPALSRRASISTGGDRRSQLRDHNYFLVGGPADACGVRRKQLMLLSTSDAPVLTSLKWRLDRAPRRRDVRQPPGALIVAGLGSSISPFR
jgi:hypothetical protein